MAFRPMRFDGSSSPVRSDGDDAGRRNLLAGAAILIMLAVIVAWYVAAARSDIAGRRDAVTMCLMNAPTPRAELTLLDQTDPLAADSGQHFTRLMYHIRDALPRDGRLTIATFGGDLGRPIEVVFDVCSPGRGAEANELTEGALPVQRAYERRFLAPLGNVADLLTVPRASPRSPIAAQIMRAANDPAIGWRGEARVLNVLTDGLENTAESRIYSGGAIRLPPPPANLLRGVTVNYFELESVRHNALQTPAVRAAWKSWFEEAGADVINMYAPGYVAPDW